LLVVESHGTGVCWLAPVDLDAARLNRINAPRGGGICGPHRSSQHAYCNVATADGGVHEVDAAITPQELQALVTIAGGEKVRFP
jgi:hypothetical protein